MPIKQLKVHRVTSAHQVTSSVNNLVVTAAATYTEDQPVAIYWGLDENDAPYYYAGIVTTIDDNAVTVELNDGSVEVIAKDEWKLVIPLKKKIKSDAELTKADVAKVVDKAALNAPESKAETPVTTPTKGEPPLLPKRENAKKNVDYPKMARDIAGFVDPIIFKGIDIPKAHKYRSPVITQTGMFPNDFSAYITKEGAGDGDTDQFQIEIRFFTSAYEVTLFARYGKRYADQFLDLLESEPQSFRFVKGESWEDLANKVVTNVNKAIATAPEKVKKWKELKLQMEQLRKKLDETKVEDEVEVVPEVKPVKQETKLEPSTKQKQMDAARQVKDDRYLDEPIVFRGEDTTRRMIIDGYVDRGAYLKNNPQYDRAASDKLMTEYRQLAKNAPIGNKNHPQTKRLTELRQMLKDPNNLAGGMAFWVEKDSWNLTMDDRFEDSIQLNPTTLRYAQQIVGE